MKVYSTSFILFLLILSSSCRKRNIELSLNGILKLQSTNAVLSNYPIKIQYTTIQSGELGSASVPTEKTFNTDASGSFDYKFRVSPCKNDKTYTLTDTNGIVILQTDNWGDIGTVYVTP